MRNRPDKKSESLAAAVRSPLRIEITQQEILADLLYPAPPRRARQTRR